MEIADELKKPEVAAATGAAGALVAAIFVPAAALLAAGAATVAGVYWYNRKHRKAAKDEIIDVKPEEGGKGK